jgi:DNA repair protein RecN (Recombination protein N)
MVINPAPIKPGPGFFILNCSMLKKLSIQNYAIIDALETSFLPGMNSVTGETGAGKSIIMGALGLILGGRADTSVLVNKGKKCIVEGIFGTDTKTEIRKFLAANNLDAEEELVLRREIAVNGKSRAFINDTPVNLDQLRQLSSLLVDLHQQFDSLQLGENDFQRQVLDALAGHQDTINEYRTGYFHWRNLQKELDELKQRKQQFDKETDYNRFQFHELDEAAFRENEIEETDAELKLLNHAEAIKTALASVVQELKESENPVVQQLKILINRLYDYSSFHPQLAELIQRLQSAQVELQDIAGDLSSISHEVNYDADKIERLNERLALGYKLMKKHGVKNTAELLAVQMQLEEKLQAVLNIDEEIQKKEKAFAESRQALFRLANNISEARKKQVKPLEEKVNKLLAQVGMPNAMIKVKVEIKDELGPYGADEIEFLFDANRSNQFLAVSKVASGGELSRLMLCIKSLVVQKLDMPTLIFDEIDTGISGEAARQVGIIMKNLSASRQVVCITHQPQIAGKADAHFLVYKENVNGSVKTNIRLLTGEERITAIAKMLSGEKTTSAALENAREMVNN